MNIPAAIIGAALLITAPATAEDLVFYSANYRKGEETIALTAQTRPIPIPPIGMQIEVDYDGKAISGPVEKVTMLIERKQIAPAVAIRHFNLWVTLK